LPGATHHISSGGGIPDDIYIAKLNPFFAEVPFGRITIAASGGTEDKDSVLSFFVSGIWQTSAEKVDTLVTTTILMSRPTKSYTHNLLEFCRQREGCAGYLLHPSVILEV
jgi:hypothetical protein